MVSTTHVRDKMSLAFAADAFKLLLEHDTELTAKVFVERVCRSLHHVGQHYNSVVALSPALTRVTGHLRSWVGLASVRWRRLARRRRGLGAGALTPSGAGSRAARINSASARCSRPEFVWPPCVSRAARIISASARAWRSCPRRRAGCSWSRVGGSICV